MMRPNCQSVRGHGYAQKNVNPGEWYSVKGMRLRPLEAKAYKAVFVNTPLIYPVNKDVKPKQGINKHHLQNMYEKYLFINCLVNA